MRGAGIEVIFAFREGDPKRVLSKAAEEWGGNCIFVGSAGLAIALKDLFWAVSAAVAARAHCLVGVVRKGSK